MSLLKSSIASAYSRRFILLNVILSSESSMTSGAMLAFRGVVELLFGLEVFLDEGIKLDNGRLVRWLTYSKSVAQSRLKGTSISIPSDLRNTTLLSVARTNCALVLNLPEVSFQSRNGSSAKS